MSRKSMNMPEYVQAYVPNTEELAMLVSKAKGPDRSMAEFSRICKVKGPSTFSRIVNELIDKPLSDELLKAIAANSADKQEVTLDALMRANGKVTRAEMETGVIDASSRMVLKSRREGIKLIKDTVTQNFLDKGYSVMLHPDLALSEKVPRSRYALSIPSDFCLHVQGQDPLFWNFIYNDTDMHNVPLKASGTDPVSMLDSSMSRYAGLFLIDAWEPEVLKDYKNTFVFTEVKAFTVFLKMISKAKINTHMSVMLVDLDGLGIVQEKEIGCLMR
ncbi:MAG: hypothetical protein K5871_00195 [Lachnospiraceae bacterium]|nr:hypothetical protein [Lachnospiraceae bacterium]